MPHSIGFILLTHSKPRQMNRLISKLNEMFDNPPITCHHDFSKCDLSEYAIPPNVSFVRPHITTRWGDFSLIEASILALDQMYGSNEGPDWFIYLSGADYPVKPAEKILADLNSHSADAYIEHMLIEKNPSNDRWKNLCHRRYFSRKIPNPFKSYKNGRKLNVFLNQPLLVRLFLPFSQNLRCYAGSQWFSGNRKTARHIINFFKNDKAVVSHYRTVTIPSESFFQTVLANAPDLRLSNQAWRYIDWSKPGAHPKTLDSEDLPKILNSDAHFARKLNIDKDRQLYDELDKIIGQPKTNGTE